MKAAFMAAGLPVGEHTIVDTRDWDEDPLGGARLIEAQLRLSGLRQARERRLQRRRQQGPQPRGDGRCYPRRRRMRPQDSDREGDRRPRGRVRRCSATTTRRRRPIGEMRHSRDFYDYDAKYLDEAPRSSHRPSCPTASPSGSRTWRCGPSSRSIAPASAASTSSFDGDGSLIIEEINTIPGFTPASMYPRLWQGSRNKLQRTGDAPNRFGGRQTREKPIA